MKWINVDERLPDPGQEVICFFTGLLYKYTQIKGEPYQNVDSVGRSTRFYVGQLVHESGMLWANRGVTHWMPLPPPPEAQP